PSSYSTGAANHENDLAAEFGFRRHALQLRFLKRPIFNPKRFGAGKRNIVVELFEAARLLRATHLWQRMCGFPVFESSCTGHDVDCIEEELRRDTRFLLVLAKSEQAEACHDY